MPPSTAFWAILGILGAAEEANFAGRQLRLHQAPSVDCKQGHLGPPPVPPSRPLPRARPSPSHRTFASEAVDRHLDQLVNNRTWRNSELATLLWNCLPNTLDTTVWQAPTSQDPRSFISTGDIPALWLRDSQNQVMPYMRYAKEEPDGIGLLIRGLIRRHVDSVLLDPLANSFDFFTDEAVEKICNPGAWNKDNTTYRLRSGDRMDAMAPGIHQRKWELDSLGSFLKLGRMYFNATGDKAPFDTRWRNAVASVVRVIGIMRQPLSPDNYTHTNYTFQTLTHEPKDTSAHGIGRFHRWTGMARTSFLPSDDSPRLPYHIPGNAFLAQELRAVAELLQHLDPSNVTLAKQSATLGQAMAVAVRTHGIVNHFSGVQVFAMEVDGYGNFFFGDDPNVPSLLGLPLTGFVNTSDSVYQNTRQLLLSNVTNPYFYGCSLPEDCPGGVLGGIVSEDASGNPGLGRVWPLSLHTRLMTVHGDSKGADAERLACLQALVESSGGTGLMHESYWYTDPSRYTRFWFAMANSYMGEVLLRLAEERPNLLFLN
eukprot:gene7205-173_t